MRFLQLIILYSLFLVLTGCGTTSNLKPVDTTGGTKKTVNLAQYKKVIVLSLKDNKASKPFKGGETFSEYIVAELEKKGIFPVISRKRDKSRAILIDGKVTNYDKGNVVAKMLIGFTAGNSNFDATVNISDNQTGKKLGTILVDKNSWALGGALAVAQTVETLMQSAASSVAEELEKAKKSPTNNKKPNSKVASTAAK